MNKYPIDKSKQFQGLNEVVYWAMYWKMLKELEQLLSVDIRNLLITKLDPPKNGQLDFCLENQLGELK